MSAELSCCAPKDSMRRRKRLRTSFPAACSNGWQSRALMPRPPILLMDEPFGALDAQTREVMHDLILYVFHLEKTTILFVTHDVEEAIYLGQRVVVMAPRPGRIDSIYDVPLPAQRTQDMKLSPEFIQLKREIVGRIRKTSGMKTDLEMLEKLSQQNVQTGNMNHGEHGEHRGKARTR